VSPVTQAGAEGGAAGAIGAGDAAEGAVGEPGGVPAGALRVGGVVPFTATDYPDALAAVIFCQGCPWHCPYCHNPHLIPFRGEDLRDFARIVEWLGTRRGLLDAVVFSGGEPTAQRALGAAIDAVRAMGFAVGLHTAGVYPGRLADLLRRVDWIGLDVKAPMARYAELCGARTGGIAAFASLDIVIASQVPYEVRTTVHPQLTSADALIELARELAARSVTRWTLQRFRATGCSDAALVADAPGPSMWTEPLLAQLREHVPTVTTRG